MLGQSCATRSRPRDALQLIGRAPRPGRARGRRDPAPGEAHDPPGRRPLDVSLLARGKVELARARVICATSCSAPSRWRARPRDPPPPPTPPPATSPSSSPTRRAWCRCSAICSPRGQVHRPGGHIGVSVRRRGGRGGDRESPTTARASRPELLPRIFEPFVQASSRRKRSLGGRASGFSLVRSLLERTAARSRRGAPGLAGGATFTARLPRGEAVVAAPVTPAADQLGGAQAGPRRPSLSHPARRLTTRTRASWARYAPPRRHERGHPPPTPSRRSRR